MARLRSGSGGTTSDSPTTDDDVEAVKRLKESIDTTTTGTSSGGTTTSDTAAVKQLKQSTDTTTTATSSGGTTTSDAPAAKQVKDTLDQESGTGNQMQEPTGSESGVSPSQQQDVNEALRNVEEKGDFRREVADRFGVSKSEIELRTVEGGVEASLTERGQRQVEKRFQRSIGGAVEAVRRDRERSAGLRVLNAQAGAKRAVAETPDAVIQRGRDLVSARGGRQKIQRESIQAELRQENPELARRNDVGLGTRVEDGRVRAVVQRTPKSALSAPAQQERIRDRVQRMSAVSRPEPEPEPSLSRATDPEVLMSTESPGAKFFGTGARERAIEREARQGSLSAQTFVGAEAIEQVGVEASRFLDEVIPDAPGSTTVQARVTGVGKVDTGIELNPKASLGGDGVRVATQVRNFVTEAPAGVGVIAALGGKAAGDIGLRVEEAFGRDVESGAQISTTETTAALSAAGTKTIRGIKEEPIGAALDVATPLAASKVSPVGVSRFDVPTGGTRVVAESSTPRKLGAAVETVKQTRTLDDVNTAVDVARRGDLSTERLVGDTTTLRGIRLKTPDVARRFTSRNLRGKTVIGLRGRRPTAGAPDVDLGDVAFERLGGDKANQGNVFEPQSGFETEVVGASADRFGGLVAERVSATRRLVRRAENIGGVARRRKAGDISETVSAVEGIPDSLANDVVDTLADQDAVIFGSGAVRAQAEGFRTPGDIDIVVPDKKAAKQALSERFESTELDVQRTFDIKEAADFAGLEEGEVFGFGARSQAPINSESGVRVNPIGEELQRKAGASAFLRGKGELTADIDVGPRAQLGGLPRTKDIDDAVAIGEELLGESDPALLEFKQAFDRGDGQIQTTEGAGIGIFDRLNDEARLFIADESAEFQLTGQARGAPDVADVGDAADVDSGRLLDDSPTPRVTDTTTRSPAPRSQPPGVSSPIGGVSAVTSSPVKKSTTSTTSSQSEFISKPPASSRLPAPESSVTTSRGSTQSTSPPASRISTSVTSQGMSKTLSRSMVSEGISKTASSPPSAPSSPSSPPSGPPSPPSQTPFTTPSSTPPRPPEDDGGGDGEEISAAVGSDFEKTFEAEVATAETVAFGNLDTLTQPGAFTEPGGRFTDTDTTPEVVDVSGNPTSDELDSLVSEEVDLDR